MDSFGLTLTASKEIRVLLERQPNGMTLKEMANKGNTYRHLSKADKKKAIEMTLKSGVIAEYLLQKPFGSDPESVFHHLKHGSLLMHKGFRVVPVASPVVGEQEPVKPVTPKPEKLTLNKQATAIQAPVEPTECSEIEMKMNMVSSADLKRQAAELMRAAEEVEKQEKSAAIKEQAAPLQLVIAKSVCLIQKHVDGLVDSMSELEKASEALRKIIAA